MSRPTEGDRAEGWEAMMQLLGEVLDPDADDGDEAWGTPNLVARVEERLPEHMCLSCFVPPREMTSAHLRGTADYLRDLASAIDDRCDDLDRS